MGQIIVGIDIGTSKVSAVIGQIDKENQLEIFGFGMEQCSGVKKGVIVDIDSTSNSIRSAVKKAESMANMKVGSAYVNINGNQTTVIKQREFISISNENREITRKDVDKLLNSARSLDIPDDRQIIDIVPIQFIVDGYDEIHDPVGMIGSKLEVDADIIVGKITSVQNIVKSMERANLKVDGLIVDALATSRIALTQDEMEMGVVLIDIGGGITDISVFRNKNMIFNDSLLVGGDHITSDVSIGLKIPFSEAEKIKREYELALTSLIKNDQEVTVIDVDEKKRKTVRVSEVVEIIEARVQEIFSLSYDILSQSDLKGPLPAGIVLAGAGISYVDGSRQISNEVFDMNVRVASYKWDKASKAEYATASGIIKFVQSHSRGNDFGSEVKAQKSPKKEGGFFSRISRFFV